MIVGPTLKKIVIATGADHLQFIIEHRSHCDLDLNSPVARSASWSDAGGGPPLRPPRRAGPPPSHDKRQAGKRFRPRHMNWRPVQRSECPACRVGHACDKLPNFSTSRSCSCRSRMDSTTLSLDRKTPRCLSIPLCPWSGCRWSG